MSSDTPAKAPPPDYMQGKMDGWVFWTIRTILLFFCRILFRMRIDGLNNVPRQGGVLVVSNHLHNADPVLISVAMPRPMHYMAKKELMTVPVIGKAIRYGGAFPVDRGKADRHAIQMATDRLQQGIAVGMFPEGTRSPTRRIERVLPGAGLIALRGNVPILPIAIVGSERLPFNGSKQMHETSDGRWRVTVTIGEPFTLPLGPDGKRLSSEEAINVAMERVAAMLPESYRGIYGTGDANP
jgi:1-acyl-sn-glycerol-3-phosphate acyltransferase